MSLHNYANDGDELMFFNTFADEFNIFDSEFNAFNSSTFNNCCKSV